MASGLRPALRLCASALDAPLTRRVRHIRCSPADSWSSAFSSAFPSNTAVARRAFSAVPASLVKSLRERTGASMGKCRDALKEEDGDIEKAVEWLRKRGVKSMEKRTADVGEAMLAIGSTSTAGAIVELKAETDYVTRNDAFQQLNTCLAFTAAQQSTDMTGESKLALENFRIGLTVADDGISVDAALMELGSRLGERLVLGQVHQVLVPASGGVLAAYAHPKFSDALAGTGRMAALVALRSSPAGGCDATRLQGVAAKLARHIVASQPRFLSIESIPAQILEKERETMRAAHLEQLGPAKAAKADEKVITKVLDGKTKKFYQDTVLLCQELIAPSESQEAPVTVPVSEWLEVEARAIGVEKLIVEDFRLAIV